MFKPFGNQTPDPMQVIIVCFNGKCGCGAVTKVGFEKAGQRRWVRLHDKPHCTQYKQLNTQSFLNYLAAHGKNNA